MDVHHITPVCEGGLDTEENAAPLCANCHDLYGGNPDKRRFIEQSRDFWYDYCEREVSPQYIAQLREMFDEFGQRVATKDDLHKAVARLEDLMQNIMNQPLSTSKQIRMIADTTAAFSDLVAMPSDAITISQDVAVRLVNKCPRCGARYAASESACPEFRGQLTYFGSELSMLSPDSELSMLSPDSDAVPRFMG